MNKTLIAKVSIAKTQCDAFDYINQNGKIGQRVKVTFGKQAKIGIITGLCEHSAISVKKLKPIQETLEPEAILDEAILSLCQWAATYYAYPLSELIFLALPKRIRDGHPASFKSMVHWQLLASTPIEPKGPKQRLAVEKLKQHPEGLSQQSLNQAGISTASLKALAGQACIAEKAVQAPPHFLQLQPDTPPILNSEQHQAITRITINKHAVHLLHGITGSGKTEVYLNLSEKIIAADKQVLVLIPEIGLTPQIVERFKKRFKVPTVVLHSGLNDTERLEAWLCAKKSIAKVIIGTRSAVFTPIPHLGLIIMDEEHDTAFKQQDGARYCARSLAIMRANRANIPIVLGSATPSLESLHNVDKNKYHYLPLTQRAGSASLVNYKVVDLRNTRLDTGIAPTILTQMQSHLDRREQVLLFINRRGYAPVLICHACAWIVDCPQCDAHMTLHRQPDYLQCHHCGLKQAIVSQCRSCQHHQMVPLGLGTQRLEKSLHNIFPSNNILRIDRDSTQRKDAFAKILDSIHSGHADILIGTQMLAKGHHFPNVTLVVILDADTGFFSTDFRATEHLGQLLVQVAGRAGRAQKPGTVAIQTHIPDHPLLKTLIQSGYMPFAKQLLEERQRACFPPFGFLVVFRIEAKLAQEARENLLTLRKKLESQIDSNSLLLGPTPAPMSKKAGVYRYQLMLRALSRANLQKILKDSSNELNALRKQRFRFIIDVDPIEVF